MMQTNSLTGVVSFECILCEDNINPCVDCLREKSIFDSAFKSGQKNASSNEQNFDGYLLNVYRTGFNSGMKQHLGQNV